MTPQHIRAARAVLKWSIRDLASQTGIAYNTVLRAEAGHRVSPTTMTLIGSALASAGIICVESDKECALFWKDES